MDEEQKDRDKSVTSREECNEVNSLKVSLPVLAGVAAKAGISDNVSTVRFEGVTFTLNSVQFEFEKVADCEKFDDYIEMIQDLL